MEKKRKTPMSKEQCGPVARKHARGTAWRSMELLLSICLVIQLPNLPKNCRPLIYAEDFFS